ncbi:MAG: hypothetical protein RMM98_07485 [Acidobacteriota bacterium]|nr:hypothetical protein [Blastocatellia bacterium]MDW8239441.1 hypothetical protein [Acidobacteriota bacterium]
MLKRFTLVILAHPMIGWNSSATCHDQSARSLRSEGASVRRHLIICLDGVGFSTLQKMYDQGQFRVFQPPARLIAPFPTLTNPAVIEILQPLGAPEARGYEDYYYDPTSDRMRGGFFARFRRKTFIEGTFRELFDYHPSGVTMTLEYAVPPVSPWLDARLTLMKIRRKFEKSTASTFIAYLGSTDPLAHIGGEWLLRNFLATLDKTCQQLIRKANGQVDITLFSDHGNHFTRYRKVNLKPELERLGFRLDSGMKDERSVVQPRYGLVGCAVLYTREAYEQHVAVAAARTPGVDLAAYKQHDTVYLVARSGRARIVHRDGYYSYVTDVGDPLQLNPIIAELQRQGRVRADGFIADADLFEATHAHIYPDAVRRLWEGLTNHVEHPASVLVSFEDGYYDGSALLDVVAVLRATHGNLRREQSSGILLTTKRRLPEAVRAADAWSLLNEQSEITLNDER